MKVKIFYGFLATKWQWTSRATQYSNEKWPLNCQQWLIDNFHATSRSYDNGEWIYESLWFNSLFLFFPSSCCCLHQVKEISISFSNTCSAFSSCCFNCSLNDWLACKNNWLVSTTCRSNKQGYNAWQST